MSQVQLESGSGTHDSVVAKKLESEDSPTATIESLTLNFPFEDDEDTFDEILDRMVNIMDWGMVVSLHTIYRENSLQIWVPHEQLPYLTDEPIRSFSRLRGSEVQYSIVGPDEIKINENRYTVMEDDFDPEPPGSIRNRGLEDNICDYNKKICNKHFTEVYHKRQFSDTEVGRISEASSVDNKLVMRVEVETDSYIVTEEFPKLWHESDSTVRFIEEVGEGSIELLEGEEVELEWISNHDGVSLDEYRSIRVQNDHSEETEKSHTQTQSVYLLLGVIFMIIIPIGLIFGLEAMGITLFFVYCYYACEHLPEYQT